MIWRLEIPSATYKYLVRTLQRRRCNATRQERREEDKMATMRKRRSRLSEYARRYKQNVRRTAHCSGGTFTFESIVRPDRTNGKCSAYGYVVTSLILTKQRPVDMQKLGLLDYTLWVYLNIPRCIQMHDFTE
jgi:hypothetical protein